jgi:hypothetical protein
MANAEHIAIFEKGVRAWNEWRKEISPGAYPRAKGVDLSFIDLSGANLTCVDFSSVDLEGTNLSGATLTGARLENANLRYTNLSRAALNETFLFLTNFDSGLLTATDFGGAHASSTNFLRVDLSATKGLDLVDHHMPSSVDLTTLRRSRGIIPERFLRGIGFPEEMIVYARSLHTRPIEFYSCFISYSHADASFARRLHDALQERGIRCWLDEHQLLPGDDIYAHVDRGIRLWDKVLLCCSEASLTSWWVDNEIRIALEKEQQLMRERGQKVQALVPLNLDGYLFSSQWRSGYEAQIRGRLASDFTGWANDNPKFDEQLGRVILAMRADSGAREDAPISRL